MAVVLTEKSPDSDFHTFSIGLACAQSTKTRMKVWIKMFLVKTIGHLPLGAATMVAVDLCNKHVFTYWLVMWLSIFRNLHLHVCTCVNHNSYIKWCCRGGQSVARRAYQRWSSCPMLPGWILKVRMASNGSVQRTVVYHVIACARTVVFWDGVFGPYAWHLLWRATGIVMKSTHTCTGSCSCSRRKWK